ncbi:PREDICTED: E3 ubiquitin ligase BIG BROTHER [Lupinus angustifolius]|uniref:E3 ubiquitin ligase BIG BROTHER n=1 Tax=Lupinus angustifolius TaxID=3871 RepID=UPI00092FBDC7|nr:PREDICTED: E3 ubiquitin ligase BIG BROTHER [Lupinus angustifolius]XP_019453970.1 PREDICTED: E3 ubiquitin ligase BIG BROTHER [Lupinus angustifolius]
MNDGRQMGLHYVDNGFPYAVNESFTGFYPHVPLNYAYAGSMPDQESVYWSMNMNPYKFGLTGPGSTSYYGCYEVNGNLPRMEINRAEWEYPSVMITEEPASTESPPRRDGVTNMQSLQTIPEECSPNNHESNNSQVIWQDNIDPDNMTYEELLDLGEAIGTESRGLSQELIDMLPTSKYKFGSLFKRKSSGKRCVICQMTYRRGDQQIKLPCNHLYHGECITKWLSINKKCPVCNVEVFGEEPTH